MESYMPEIMRYLQTGDRQMLRDARKKYGLTLAESRQIDAVKAILDRHHQTFVMKQENEEYQ